MLRIKSKAACLFSLFLLLVSTNLSKNLYASIEDFSTRSQQLAILIENTDYSELPKLKGERERFDQLADILATKYGFTVKVIRNATALELYGQLKGVSKNSSPGSRMFIAFNGHCKANNDGSYWMGVEAEPGNSTFDSVSVQDVSGVLDNSMVNEALVLAPEYCYPASHEVSPSSNKAIGNVKLINSKDAVGRIFIPLLTGPNNSYTEALDKVIDFLSQGSLIRTASELAEAVNRQAGMFRTDQGVRILPSARTAVKDFYFVPTNKGAENPVTPLLRIETGMHTAGITSIDVDQAERFLVTGSIDKTVRIWSLKSGELLRTLRLPIGEGNEGKVYTVALSPDGGTIAVGGWINVSGDGSSSVYLFDRQTGQIVHRLEGLPKTINSLSWSSDGHHLAMTLGGSGGLLVYETQDWMEVYQDISYEGSSISSHFDQHGRLVTTSFDGYIRLYGEDFQLIYKVKALEGEHPAFARFSPDGAHIAVGLADAPVVNVLSGQNLAWLYNAETENADNGNLKTVAWSQDGNFLYAGGRYSKGGTSPILRWADAGRGKATPIHAGQHFLTDLHSLNNGGLVFGTGEPIWGILDDEGRYISMQRSSIMNFASLSSKEFLVSHDGETVQFANESTGFHPIRFTISERSIDTDPKKNKTQEISKIGLTPPLTEAPGLTITGWKRNRTTRLNGRPLELQAYDLSLSLAITPDEEHFLIGTLWNLYLYDKNGRLLWQVPTANAASGVNISGNGKLAVVASDDGTLRWYRLADGRELIALFPHKDGNRWVTWTPEGFYQASTGGDNLIGWHLNHGGERPPEFFGASRFRDQFYRPDVVSRVLDTLDVDKALAQADKERGTRTTIKDLKDILPPTITILSPLPSTEIASNKLALFYVSESTTGSILDVKAKVNGRPAKVLTHRHRRINGAKGQFIMMGNITVEVPPKDAVVSLIAINQHGESEPENLATKWIGQEDWYKPNLYVLAVGVSSYDQEHLNLNYAAKDAEDFIKTMKAQEGGGGLYKMVSYKLLVSDKTRKEATLENILDGLDWIERKTTSRDVAVVFLSGHGANDIDGNYNFLPQDVDTSRLRRTAIDDYNIKKYLSNIAGKTVLFVDSSRSGNLRLASLGRQSEQADQDRLANELAADDSGVIVFSSSTGKQVSQEKEVFQNGVFTEALLEGIEKGTADFTKNSHISIAELELFVSNRVKEMTNGKQKPVSAKLRAVEDFLIFRVLRSN